MHRPKCAICRNKINNRVYVWNYEKKTLEHQACLDINREVKDVIVTVKTLSLGIERKEE